MTTLTLTRRAALQQRQRARYLHVIAGLLVGPFIAVATLTGLVYAFAPSIEQVVYHDAYTSTSTLPARSLEEQVAAAQKEYPQLKVSGVQRSDDARDTTRVLFADPSLTSSSYRRAVFVDPGDLRITGNMIQYGSSNASPLRAWLSEGHKQLWLGKAGRWYSELAASWLGAIAISGLVLALRSRASKQRASRWHRTLGLWLVPGMLFLTVTGLTWSGVAGQNIGTVRTELQLRAPAMAVSPAAATDVSGLDTAVRVAREDGLTGLVEAKPAGAGTWQVQESREPYRLSTDKVQVDTNTAEVTDRVLFSEWPFAAKLTEWLINLHMGFLFGIWSETALALLALGILVVTGLGYYMWWRAWRSGRSWVPARGERSWALIAVLIGYSIVAPLFGISLLAFVFLNMVVQALLKKRTAAEA